MFLWSTVTREPQGVQPSDQDEIGDHDETLKLARETRAKTRFQAEAQVGPRALRRMRRKASINPRYRGRLCVPTAKEISEEIHLHSACKQSCPSMCSVGIDYRR